MAKSQTPAADAVLVKYLNEAYGKEQQLEVALKAQVALAQRPQLKKGLQEHLKVTKAQSRALKKRIKELGGEASTSPDLPGPEVVADLAASSVGAANKAVAAAKGPLQALRGTSAADNQLRNIRDCLWNEAEEIAHYNVIEAAADALNDRATAKLARDHRAEEEKMQRLLERQIGRHWSPTRSRTSAPLVKEVIKEEVPAAERRASKPAKRSTASSKKTKDKAPRRKTASAKS